MGAMPARVGTIRQRCCVPVLTVEKYCAYLYLKWEFNSDACAGEDCITSYELKLTSSDLKSHIFVSLNKPTFQVQSHGWPVWRTRALELTLDARVGCLKDGNALAAPLVPQKTNRSGRFGTYG